MSGNKSNKVTIYRAARIGIVEIVSTSHSEDEFSNDEIHPDLEVYVKIDDADEIEDRAWLEKV